MTFFTAVQYKILRAAFPGEPTIMSGAAYEGKSKIRTLMGEDVLDQFKGKTVIDFGCGCGNEVVEIAGAGARMVIGLDIQPDSLETARRAATSAGLSDRCSFASRTEVKADIVVSLDSFEHFNDP